MSAAPFLRLHDVDPEARSLVLKRAVGAVRCDGNELSTFWCEPSKFASIPGAPFAYWVSDGIRNLFASFPPLESEGRHATKGLATTDDTRFLRLWWEIRPSATGSSSETSGDARERWVDFAKGGAFGRFFSDLHLVINWGEDGNELKKYLDEKIGRENQWSRWINAVDYYFKPGITWPLRAHTYSPRALPARSIFSVRGYVLFAAPEDRTPLLGFLAGSPFDYLFKVCLGRAGYPEFLVGIIKQLPFPNLSQTERDRLTYLTTESVVCARGRSIADELTHVFHVPSAIGAVAIRSRTLRDAGSAADEVERERLRRMLDFQAAIDAVVAEIYGLSEEEQERIRAEVSGGSSSAVDGAEDASDDTDSVADEDDDEEAVPEDLSRRVANLLMWCVGVAYGRWDVRTARDPSLIPALQGPFERLPRVAPGGLVGPDGLPATSDRIASEAWLRARPNVITLPEPGSFEGPESITAEQYPFQVAWDGILVDDEGHPRDLVAKVREVLAYVYGSAERAQEIEAEALEILQAGGRTPMTLRDWFRNQKATELGKTFFDLHVQRYSKSRRKAPIYWRLTSNPGRGQAEYSLWLYYHRLTGDTLWTALTHYVGPKRDLEQRRLEDLRRAREGVSGAERSRIEKEIESKLSLLEELDWFETRLRAVAERGYAPDLDDGVIINLAPLHELMPWNEPEKVWKKLEKGEYDWAKLAMRYWPERVREKCSEDKSLAIAHGMRD